MQYDELGFNYVPQSWVTLYEADIRSVLGLSQNRLTLKPEAQPVLLNNGTIGRFVAGALVRPACLRLGASCTCRLELSPTRLAAPVDRRGSRPHAR